MKPLSGLAAVSISAFLAACGGNNNSLPAPISMAPASAHVGSSARFGATSAHLYVANYHGFNVTAYAKTGGAPVRTLSQGVTEPDSVAFDSAGDLYVANFAQRGSVTVYGPGGTSPILRIAKGVYKPTALAIDSSVLPRSRKASVFRRRSRSTPPATSTSPTLTTSPSMLPAAGPFCARSLRASTSRPH
jgi:hypothetical protein